MPVLIADIEANGFPFPAPGREVVSEIFCVGILDVERDAYTAYAGDEVLDGLLRLEEADCIAGHNWLQYDATTIDTVFGVTCRRDHVRDTLVASRFAGRYQPREDDSADEGEEVEIPLGGHGLDDWGRRLGYPKGDIDHSRYAGRRWRDLTGDEQAEMLVYLERDVRLGKAIYGHLSHLWREQPEPLRLEHDVAAILPKQMQHGIRFDKQGAERHATTLRARKAELEAQLGHIWPPQITPEPSRRSSARRTIKVAGLDVVIPRRTYWTPVATKAVNPRSRPQMIEKFSARGWEPIEHTPKGNPKLNRAALEGMPWPEAKVLSRYYDTDKILGMVADGQGAWLRHVCPDGRIYGSVAGIGASTHRMSHSRPNLAQVPKGASERALFLASEGMVFVDVDAASLEARLQAHFFARYDGGAFRDLLLSGQSIHEANMEALEAPSKDCAKALLYAFTYGAQYFRLGHIYAVHAMKADIIDAMPSHEIRVQAGEMIAKTFRKTMPGLVKAIEATQKEFKDTGRIVALDGRPLYPAGPHSAFNTRVQGAGSIIMKRALVLFQKWRRPGVKYCANVHDELLLECPPELAEETAEAAKHAIVRAGEYYRLKCPMAGEAHIGRNWKEVHG